MKTPPFLLGTALLFWGWQTNFLPAGAVMAVVLEGARRARVRWEISDEDFARIWTFCTVLAIAAAVYAFAASDGPAQFGDLFQKPDFAHENQAGNSTTQTATALIRWLPMILFLFVAAQTYSTRESIRLETISLILRRRWKKAQKSGQPAPATRNVNVTYPYFIVCLFAASVHAAEDGTFFLGMSGLLVWALWAQRSRRFSPVIWVSILAAVVVCGYFGQSGVARLQGYLQNLDAKWLAGFVHGGTNPKQTRTALGQIGQMKLSGTIVIRLQTKDNAAPPTYLRDASYRIYKPPMWLVGSRTNDFSGINAETNGTTWVLLPGKTNTAAVNIACYLPGGEALLPLPTGSGRLEHLPAYVLQANSAGAVLAEGPGLVIFDARYGPGSTIDAPFDTRVGGSTNEDLSVPAREKPALDEVISEMGCAGKNPGQQLLAVNSFFQEKFKYSLWQGKDARFGTNETALSRFLLHTRSGHCEYFATATVLLLRELGIPARYAVGFAVHEASGAGYVVRLRDAHAWCLVWHDGTWQDFDTTPVSWVEVEGSRASSLQFLSDAGSWVWFEFSKVWWNQGRLRQYIFWALIPVLALLLYQIVFRKRQRRQNRKPGNLDLAANWPGLDSEFYQLEQQLTGAGLPREPHEPLSLWLARAAADPALVCAKDSLEELLRLHYRLRFDPPGLSGDERETLRRDAASCLQILKETMRGGDNKPAI